MWAFVMLTTSIGLRAGRSENRFGHFVFGQTGIVRVGLGSTGCGESNALVEGYGGVIGIGDHKAESVGRREASPGFDCVDEELAGAGSAVGGGNPHGD